MTFILKKVEDFSKEEIKNLVAGNCKVLDKSLEIIGRSLGTRGERLWDLIGVDDRKRLVLINVELRYNDKMLYQIVNRLDWAWENMENINKMHPSYMIDDSQMPRVIVVSPSYSPFFKKSITYLNYRIKIDLFTFTYLENAAEKGIFLEPVEIKVRYDHVLKADSKSVKPIEVSDGTKVTTEEIMEFLH
ncbi:MAG: hypothetical protein KAR43_10560 [Deltaproteobacteria bacterium]|jgi:hypothetical protein|nr:hypothetical protein [Deltaproteobacteria bacterium]